MKSLMFFSIYRSPLKMERNTIIFITQLFYVTVLEVARRVVPSVTVAEQRKCSCEGTSNIRGTSFHWWMFFPYHLDAIT